MQFYFRHCGTTAALPADDLAEYDPFTSDNKVSAYEIVLIIES